MNLPIFNGFSKSVFLLLEDLNLESETARKLRDFHFNPIQFERNAVTHLEIKSTNYDFAILGMEINGQSGIEIAKILKKNYFPPPVMLISSKLDSNSVCLALDNGIDYCLSAPFDWSEFTSRINAIMRRASLNRRLYDEKKVFSIGPLSVNKLNFTVCAFGEHIDLTRSEFEILVCFLNERGKVVNKERLASSLGDFGNRPATRTVDNHVSNLRQKLKILGKNIKTVRGLGYKFILLD